MFRRINDKFGDDERKFCTLFGPQRFVRKKRLASHIEGRQHCAGKGVAEWLKMRRDGAFVGSGVGSEKTVEFGDTDDLSFMAPQCRLQFRIRDVDEILA